MKFGTLIMCLTLFFFHSSCNPADKNITPPPNPGDNGTDPEAPGGNNDIMNIRIMVGSHEFTAKLSENATATAFKEMMPLRLDMTDVNRNEKYIRLGSNLPTSAVNPGTIRTGDLMLWGSDGLVLFYKTFPTTYSYTPLATMDNPENLESILGGGNVTVVFENAN